MQKFVPYEKLSKKKRRALDAKRRGSWYGLNPVTRKPENSRAYNRRKAREWRKDLQDRAFVCWGLPTDKPRGAESSAGPRSDRI